MLFPHILHPPCKMKFLLNTLLALLVTSHGFSQGSEPPEITSISITPSVDVTSGDQTITATIQVIDNELGFDFGNLFLYRADGNFVSSHGMGASQLVSGDTFDGTYEVEMTIPQYAPGGTWGAGFCSQ